MMSSAPLSEDQKIRMMDEMLQSIHALLTGKATLQFVRSPTASGNAASVGQSVVTGVRVIKD